MFQPLEWCSEFCGGAMLHRPPIVWLGKTGDARNPRNYSGGKVPGHGDSLVIPAGAMFPAVDMSRVELASVVAGKGCQVGTSRPLGLAGGNDDG